MKSLLLVQFVIQLWSIVLGNELYNQHTEDNKDLYMENEIWLRRMNVELKQINKLSAQVTWQALIGGPTSSVMAESRTKWRNTWCSRSFNARYMTDGQKRQLYLLCRGPKYTPHQARELTDILESLQDVYTDTTLQRGPHYPTYHIEPDLVQLMRKSRDPAELLWAWHEWRRLVGPPIVRLYPALISIQNQGARNNGYQNMAECWKEELETPNLEAVADQLFQDVFPVYKLLHAYVRYKLVEVYGADLVGPNGLVPAHVLGDMWAQNWDSLLDDVIRSPLNLDRALRAKNYTVLDLVKHAEDFFVSLGLEPMTEQFWKYSQIKRPSNNSRTTCHGTAANMFSTDDYRMLMCADVTLDDFYVIHHEMGHIQYYMAYKDQPVIFQDGANSAFQEAIGDTVMLGVSTPQHLERLNLINDSTPSSDLDIPLLLRQALNKLPQLAFGLIVDKWRWKVMSGRVLPQDYNKAWWELRQEYQGVSAPTARSNLDFDPAAKFHIADNTPYIRYFLSGILQMQFFEAMCRTTVFGEYSREAVPMPLHRCDIYGSNKAGDKLRDMMSLGSSVPWHETLSRLTDGHVNTYSTSSLLKYFQPLEAWLQNEIQSHHIPVGCDMMSLGSSVPWHETLSRLTDGHVNTYSTSSLLKYFQPLEAWLQNEIQSHHIPVGCDMMSLGSSVPWHETLSRLTDGHVNTYSTSSLLKYFQPLEAWLQNEIQSHHIPVGW